MGLGHVAAGYETPMGPSLVQALWWLELGPGPLPEMAGREFWGFLELGVSLLLGSLVPRMSSSGVTCC